MTADAPGRNDFACREMARTTFRTPVVLEAGAGTGKTAVLVSRIVTWALRDGFDLAAEALPGASLADVARRVWQRTIAITFTEAAAAEMDERIRLALQQLQAGSLPVGVPADSGLADAPGADRRITALLDQVEHLAVSTIHSFCSALLQAHPIEARIHPDFRLDAPGVGIEEIARDEVRNFVKHAFREEGNPGGISLMGLGYGPSRIQDDLLCLLQQGADPAWLLEHPYPEDRMRALCEDLLSAARTVLRGLEPLRSLANKDGTARRPGNLKAPEVADACEGLLAPGLDHDAASLKAAAAAFDKSVLKKLKEWGGGAFARKELDLFPDTDSLRDGGLRLSVLVALFQSFDFDILPEARPVLHALLAAVEDRRRRSGILTFHDLLLLSRNLLRNHPEVLRSIQGGIDQLLVDEFQDTDPLQYDIVRLIALTGDARPGLFLVGDPKQSIYGWRRADLSAYDEFKRGLPEGSAVASLFVNFRSLPPILKEVERVIAPVMVEEHGLQPPFEPLEPSDRNAADPGLAWSRRNSVEVWHCRSAAGADAAREQEAQAIAEDIAALNQEFDVPWKATGILLRTKSSMPVYLRALEAEGIPAVVRGDRSFYQRREILDIANLARAALEPHDRIALVGWLRSPVVGLPDAALPSLWRAGLPEALARHRSAGASARIDVLKVLDQAKVDMPANLPETAAVPGYEALLLDSALRLFELRRLWDEEPVDAFVRGLRDLFAPDVSEALRFGGTLRVRAMDRFYERILADLTGGACDQDRMLRAIREALDSDEESDIDLLPDDGDADCVRIMTVHNSKGLDFDNVYLPDLQRAEKRKGDAKARAEAPADGPRYRLAGIPSCDFFQIEDREREVAEAESIRLLYVGMTRARKRLVMSGDPESRSFSRSWGLRHVMNGLDLPAGAPDSRDGVEHPTENHAVRIRILPLFEQKRVRRVEPNFLAIDPRTVAHQVRQFRERSELAGARMALPWTGRATDAGSVHGDDLMEIQGIDAEEDRELLPPSASLSRDHAALLGSAAHRALQELAGCPGGIEAIQAAVAAAVAEFGDADPGFPLEARLVELLLPDGPAPLLRRFLDLGSRVAGCEIPVAVATERDWTSSPVRTGRVDFLYWDSDTDEFAVADWKTEPLNDRSPAEAAGGYLGQAGIYTEAVRRAFELAKPPRFELWYLRAGRIIAVHPA